MLPPLVESSEDTTIKSGKTVANPEGSVPMIGPKTPATTFTDHEQMDSAHSPLVYTRSLILWAWEVEITCAVQCGNADLRKYPSEVSNQLGVQRELCRRSSGLRPGKEPSQKSTCQLRSPLFLHHHLRDALRWTARQSKVSGFTAF